ncbi:MAG: hypothetical protein A2186_01575 [Candidatus Levybacteria bacterium RIFOXYA1_FULL_41_10]|nr:MAG: Type III restriction enzyme, res subunit [Candidatus Levybacteria bacterium GW2011_GWA1_39_32]KKR51502.1 MAG: Type III restriction enzyme, res subunit [Candidatus Levybacteria bacterium GW2011_GWC1_40_19]KKR95433.1 MAG: Type III restriction enzyme, res subunit [Candidatus Levybacteria bacterium GW2011_GWA2_41_15]KKS01918.1 MAG: Type III restriction enzyme, res subunit [Candidatus Levybacteria bacterium GW2011_GWB1_41_21]OGH20850.1 MAG: hypothetical protein A2695_00655 [Candidatus Levyba
MKLKRYQETAVDKLLKASRILLAKDGQRVCVFKAPTGSGKTIVVADYLRNLADEQLPSKYAFLWISGNDLHKQSRGKLEDYLNPSRYTFSYLDDIQNNELKENEIAFVNWHSLIKQDRRTGEYTNLYMRENENDRNLRTFINNTKEKGLQIILIVDESHYHYWSEKSQNLVQDVIAPKLTIEVSATPKLEPKPEDIANEDAGYISVKFEDVIEQGMIKKDVVINEEIGKYKDFNSVADEVILESALAKQKELIELYKNRLKINPLILIQLPNESETMSALDVRKIIFVMRYLHAKHNITVGNGLLGIWLSDRKENIETISNNDDGVRVLIFKQAIALGWDCPRAQILIMFRDIKSVTFEIQTVGRILRMPEAKHYDSDELNQGFVYSNLPKIQIAKDSESKSFFRIQPAHRIGKYKEVKLPSTYLRRIDYGDLTLSFRKLLIEEANKYFGIKEKDMPAVAKKKADKELELLPKELTTPIISDVILQGIDDVENVIGKIVNFTMSEDDLKFKFEFFAKACSLPYAPVRSHTKIQQGLYDWFDNYLGYGDVSRIEIQRIVICSESNQKIFKEIIESAKERFKELDRKDKEAKQVKKELLWDVPEVEYFNELHEKVEVKNYSLSPCYLRTSRSIPEQKFEEMISKSKSVLYWYKNGTNKEVYFAIPYIHPQDGLQHSFYPDYIVFFKDKIGIYDTKSGIHAESDETVVKANVLHDYIRKNKARKLIGGIVISKSAGMFVHEGAKYNKNTTAKGWERIKF